VAAALQNHLSRRFATWQAHETQRHSLRLRTFGTVVAEQSRANSKLLVARRLELRQPEAHCPAVRDPQAPAVSQSNIFQGSSMNRRHLLKSLIGIAFSAMAATATAADTIKVGVLHSLSGTMAISETALKNTALMAIEEINAKDGLLGKKLEPVVVDPASNWPLFAEKARQLIT